tara:strand:+ start:463 stop:837 length:375 start_codon:yes stop_codon:yes gene_type:complete
MGYRSEVVFAVSKEVVPALMCLFAKKPEVQKLCTVDSELDTDYQDGWLMRWDWIKWYESDTVINDLANFIEALESDDLSDYGLDDDADGWYHHFKFIRIGEEYEDIESKGWGFDDIQLNRAISY